VTGVIEKDYVAQYPVTEGLLYDVNPFPLAPHAGIIVQENRGDEDMQYEIKRLSAEVGKTAEKLMALQRKHDEQVHLRRANDQLCLSQTLPDSRELDRYSSVRRQASASTTRTIIFNADPPRGCERKITAPSMVDGREGKKRSVVLPKLLVSKFLAVASANSAQNIETLGTLGGKLSNNTFTITHLLIPQQSGKSDRCNMEVPEELLDIHIKEDLVLVGWIHTHPAFDVFLSSVDMHNHYVYQKMLPEVIAIVCSNKFRKTGILTLTEQGMREIGSCQLRDFHPHTKDPPLYKIADHVYIDDKKSFNLIDLRK
jgi:proteasome lid subunit RPN8/RPN11